MRASVNCMMTIAVIGMMLCAIMIAFGAPSSPGTGTPVTRDALLGDGTMIAPGFGSDGILLGEDINAVIVRFGKSRFKLSKPDRARDLFSHVLKIAGPVKILFDAIYNNEERRCAACVFRGKVVAVIGFESGRTTTDNVNIQSGAENFIFNYGNRSLRTITSGTNKMYCYPGLGIVVADDDMNDTIDLYLVFPPVRGSVR